MAGERDHRADGEASLEEDLLSKYDTEHGAGDRVPADHEDLGAVTDLAHDKYPRFLRGTWEKAGGMGQLTEVYDRLLGRTLVRKRPLQQRQDPAGFRAFVHEAQVTAQLNHPCIVPLLDLRHDEEGFHYLMPRVVGTNLHEVLAGLAAKNGTLRHRFGLTRLLHAFRTVCGAVAHANEQGVVHRDLKPDQIVFGEHDEVLVLDWGLAARVGGAPVSIPMSPGEALADPGSIRSGQTVLYGLHGAPRYQPPERLVAGPIPAATAQDVYALGAVLYHVLAYRPPVATRKEDEPREGYLARIREQIVDLAPPSSYGVWDPPFDKVWDRIALRCLAFEAGDRYADAGVLYREVESALSELVEAERRRERAALAVAKGSSAGRELARQQRKLARAREQRRVLQDRIAPHQPIEAKRDLWAAEDREQELALVVTAHFVAAERAYELALSHDGGCRDARESLADLYEDRLREAEAEGDAPTAAYYLTRLRDHDDGRRLARRERAGTLTVEGVPRGAMVRLASLVEEDRRLVPAGWRDMGATPMGPIELEQGRFQLEVAVAGRATARYAILIEAGDELRLWPTLPLSADVPDGFVYIPAGPCWIGGDPRVPDAGPRRRIDLFDFSLSVYPVTMGQYREFIEALDIDEARERVPREPSDDVRLWRYKDGCWVIPEADTHGDPMTPETPALLVRVEDAEAYCGWRSERDGRRYRLPTRNEWEYAARSGDGRLFPWGDRYEPMYCWGGDRQQGKGTPTRIGAVPEDVSPAGVRDLAGNVADWLADDYADDGTLRHVGGGVWFSFERTVRVARRVGFRPADRTAGLGFRLLLDL